MKQEFTAKPISGYLALFIAILFIGGSIAGISYEMIWLGVILTLLFIFTVIGFTVVYPNGSCVMVFFGDYREEKNAMVGNLMVVLCGDKDATPVVNTGTLNS